MNTFLSELQDELDAILQWWMTRMVDDQNGGFYGRIDGRGVLHPEADKGAILNARILGKTLGELRAEIAQHREQMERELDSLTARLVESGIATSSGPSSDRHLIVRGQANLLEDLKAQEDLERIRLLFADLETQTELIDLLTRAEAGDGVRIFIGSENKLFSMSGSSIVAAPFRDGEQRIVGVVGIIGPTRLNYARIVPMVDYTAQLISRLLR